MATNQMNLLSPWKSEEKKIVNVFVEIPQGGEY
ncbi:MAG: hypothetical protein KatS3mg087_0795 [Patescibacteria group bacterium]|nr:MAG: hypothetical protein KatS3mg087_0795 [Patescibacteria group bacterium]